MAFIRISGKHAELKRGALIGGISALALGIYFNSVYTFFFNQNNFAFIVNRIPEILIVGIVIGALIHKYVVG